jgi:uncharacterized membrane protein YebE (DUF533 family)
VDHLDAFLAAIGMKATKGGAVVAFAGWAISSAAAAWFGAMVALGGLGISAYFSWKRDKREQQEHDARMKEIRNHETR